MEMPENELPEEQEDEAGSISAQELLDSIVASQGPPVLLPEDDEEDDTPPRQITGLRVRSERVSGIGRGIPDHRVEQSGLTIGEVVDDLLGYHVFVVHHDLWYPVTSVGKIYGEENELIVLIAGGVVATYRLEDPVA